MTVKMNVTVEQKESPSKVSYEITTWNHGPYSLSMIQNLSDSKEVLNWRVSVNDYDAPSVYNEASWMEEGGDYQVNWSAHGTRPASEAREYAKKLMVAADVAEEFTKIHNTKVSEFKKLREV